MYVGISSDMDFALTLYSLLNGALTPPLCQQEHNSHVAAYVCVRMMRHVWIITY